MLYLSEQPPSLTDDESAAGSVWLHSKAGPDMAELPDGDQEPLASSGLEEPDDTGHPQVRDPELKLRKSCRHIDIIWQQFLCLWPNEWTNPLLPTFLG